MARKALLCLPLLIACKGGTGTPADATGAVDHNRDDHGTGVDAPREAASGDVTLPSDVAPSDAATIPGLPLIHNHSGASLAHVTALAQVALKGLGFPAGSVEGPNADDRVFVGRYYLAWIDQTGFFGKINGLWRLNGQSGASLDFVLKDPDGRPVSFLVPGEDGDGRWPAGYPGGEHVEFPNRTPEANDNPACAQSDWCNQYGLNEAAQITDPDIPWWSACNKNTPPWTAKNNPIVEQTIAGGLKLVYEGPLVKEADGDGVHDGDDCHADYLFEDGMRRKVYLRVGYELFADAQHLDRTMQLRNPAGNPQFKGAMSLIGGFVVTRWPHPHYLKQLNRYLRPETKDVADTLHGITLKAGQWTAHPFDPTTKDEVFAWLDQPISLGAAAAYAEGRSATLSHVGPSDNQDVGICFCSVHGGLELGGGLIHANISLPIAGGATSIEAKRRLTLPGSGGSAVKLAAFTYEAEKDLQHKIGKPDGDGWSASTADDQADHMAYGPYATTWGGGSAQATFWLMVDNNNADNLAVVTLDIHDATASQILVSRQVRRKEFDGTMSYQPFSLNVDLSGRAGHAMETRVLWHDVSYVKLDRVTVKTAN